MTLPFDRIVDDLSEHGYSVSDEALDTSGVAALAAVSLARRQRGSLVRARTGKVRTENETLRGDSISWIDEHSPEAPVIACLEKLEALRLAINQHLFLNVQEIESHLAIYPPGARYQRHLDQFATGPQLRQLSFVLYLNDAWSETNGGALRLYLGDEANDHVDVAPIGGRLVLFESARFWHEVLPADRERMSLTGWFRSRTRLSAAQSR